MRIVSVQRHNSNLNSVFTVQKITGCNFQYGPNLRIPLDPSFWLWWLFLSWKSVFTTCHCINCENYAVSFVMKYCPISTTFRNHASVQHLLNLSCCDSFSVRSPYCCSRRFLLAKSSQSKKRFCLEHAQHEWATWFFSDIGLPRSVAKGLVTFRTFMRLFRKDWAGLQNNYAKKSQSFPNRLQKVSTILHVLWFLVDLWTMDL